MSSNNPRVAIIVLNFNGVEHLKYCLPSLEEISYQNTHYYIVDNASSDESLDFIKNNHENFKLIASKKNLGWSGGCNLGIMEALEDESEIILLANNDIKVHPKLIDYAVQAFQSSDDIGFVGCNVFGAHERVPESDYIEACKRLESCILTEEKEFIDGMALFVHKKVFKKIGFIDEAFFAYGEETDFQIRGDIAGFKKIKTNAPVWHYSSGSWDKYPLKASYFYIKNNFRIAFKHFQITKILSRIKDIYVIGCNPFIKYQRNFATNKITFDSIFVRRARYSNIFFNFFLITYALLQNCFSILGILKSKKRDLSRIERINYSDYYMNELPAKYQIFENIIRYKIPGYDNFLEPKNYVLSPFFIENTESWYREFRNKVIESIGKDFLPIARISDGEMSFCKKKISFDKRWSLYDRVYYILQRSFFYLNTRGRFEALTAGRYHSGKYTQKEKREMQKRYSVDCKKISEQGILAIHTEHDPLRPFHESKFPEFKDWLDKSEIKLDRSNYFPFYFIYAALNSSDRSAFFEGLRVLVINGETGKKKESIVEGLYREGAHSVSWEGISKNRSLYDKIDVSKYENKIDIVYLGAGIGKFNILCQLSKLSVPVIDSGFVFEVWSDPSSKKERPYLMHDKQFQNEFKS